MSVVVYRNGGGLAGDDITDEVLTTEAMQRERGRQEINGSDSDRVTLSGTAVNADFMMPGSIVSVGDSNGMTNGYLEQYAKNVTISGSYSVSSSVVIEQIKTSVVYVAPEPVDQGLEMVEDLEMLETLEMLK